MAFPAQEPGWPTWVNETYDDLPQRILIREIDNVATMFANASLCHALHYAQHDPHGDNIPMHAIIGDVFRPLSRSPTSSRTIFPENAIDLNHEPDMSINPSIQIQRFFFYADFIRDRVINGEKQPLLTSVHNPGLSIKETQLSYTINYTVPLYIPVKPMILQHLRVAFGRPQQPRAFQWGKCSHLTSLSETSRLVRTTRTHNVSNHEVYEQRQPSRWRHCLSATRSWNASVSDPKPNSSTWTGYRLVCPSIRADGQRYGKGST